MLGGSEAILLFALADVNSVVKFVRLVTHEKLWIPLVLLTLLCVFLLSRKINSMKGGLMDSAEPPTQYPEGFSFVSNRIRPEDFRALGEQTRQKELEKLYRTEDWRAHIRERGSREENYNWQLRKRLGLPDSPSRGAPPPNLFC